MFTMPLWYYSRYSLLKFHCLVTRVMNEFHFTSLVRAFLPWYSIEMDQLMVSIVGGPPCVNGGVTLNGLSGVCLVFG